MKILQDLENKRETRDSRKRARREARGAWRGQGSVLGGNRVCGATDRGGFVRGAHTQDALTPNDDGLDPYAYAAIAIGAGAACGAGAAPAWQSRAIRRPRGPLAGRAAADRGSSAHNANTAATMSPPPSPPLHFSLTLRFVTLFTRHRDGNTLPLTGLFTRQIHFLIEQIMQYHGCCLICLSPRVIITGFGCILFLTIKSNEG